MPFSEGSKPFFPWSWTGGTRPRALPIRGWNAGCPDGPERVAADAVEVEAAKARQQSVANSAPPRVKETTWFVPSLLVVEGRPWPRTFATVRACNLHQRDCARNASRCPAADIARRRTMGRN